MNASNELILLTLGIAVLLGCNHTEPAGPSSSPQPVVNAPPPPPPLPAAKPPEMVQKKAAVGVGEKGHYDAPVIVSPIVVPVATLFAAKEKIAFEIEIPEAMKLFKATEDRVPKSHEEFMQRIIKENHIILPLLPEGHHYVYDPKRGELMVEQPAK